jgi:MFS family permease
MGITLSQFWWGIMRLCGGISSAILFIVISAQVAETLVRRGYGHWMGALYGGIGLGIAISGLVVPQLDKAGGWNFAWIGMGIIAIIFALMGIALGWKSVQTKVTAYGLPKPAAGLGRIRILAAAYFLEGLGYIVTATFIVTVISMTPGLETLAPYSWVAVGLSAIPSTIIWTHLAHRIGNRQTLLAAYALQASGILVSVQAETTAEVLFAAVTFGGTFLGIVAVTLAEGKLRMGREGGLSVAFLTASFSVGQMIGPVIAGRLADWQDGFALPLLLAAISVILGGVLIALDRNFSI